MDARDFRFRKNFKHLAFVILLIFTTIQMQGQEQVRFGVKGGMNMSSFNKFTLQDYYTDVSIRFAYHAGIFTEIPISALLSVQPELLFSSKGTRYKIYNTFTLSGTTGYSHKSYMLNLKYKPCYIELPVYLKAGFEAGVGKIIVGIGPYIAYGVCGKLKTDVGISLYSGKPPLNPTNTIKEKKDVFEPGEIEIPLYNSHLKRFDAGFAGYVGYELNSKISFTVGFQKGLANIDNFDEKRDQISEKLKNKTLALSVEYKF